MTIPLKQQYDIKLVCVVNGLASSFENYEGWGRVRSLQVWAGEDKTAAQTTVLQSLGTDTFPNAQFAAKNLGKTDAVTIRLLDAYVGLTTESYDPDICLVRADSIPSSAGVNPEVQQRFEPGCIVKPTPLAGLSSVYLFVDE